MKPLMHLIPLLTALSQPPQPFPAGLTYINSASVTLTFQTAVVTEIDQTQVWVSNGVGTTWTTAAVTPTGRNAIRFDAPEDGKYSFYIVLANESGRSARPPSDGTKPHVTVVVDTAPPTLQIHKARCIASSGGEPLVRLNVSLVEENLGDAGTRLFHRDSAGGPWQDGGTVVFIDGVIDWQPPADEPAQADLRLLVTDLAGNRALDEIDGVRMVPPPSAGQSPASPPKSAPEQLERPALADADTVPPLAPVTIAPIPPVTLDDQTEATSDTAEPRLDLHRQVDRLRELASRYLAEGKLSLAGARLEDALELVPNDPDLRADLGDVLYRTRQYDEAALQFRGALESSPDHLGAIEGLALVEATQNRYPQARSHLRHLLELRPLSAKHWLHYGDIEHMLGNNAAAEDAWNRVLKIEPADNGLREKARKRIELFAPKAPDSQ